MGNILGTQGSGRSPDQSNGCPTTPSTPQEEMSKKHSKWVSKHLPKWCRLTRRMDSGIPKGGTFELPRWKNLYKNYKTKLIEPDERADWRRWTAESYKRQQRAQGIFIVETDIRDRQARRGETT